MNWKEAVKAAIKSSGMTYADVAVELGYDGDSPHQWIGNKLANRKRMDVGFAASLLDVVGMKLVVMPKGRKVPDGCFEICAE